MLKFVKKFGKTTIYPEANIGGDGSQMGITALEMEERPDKKWFIIRADNKYKGLFDWLIVVMVLWNLLFIPLVIAYDVMNGRDSLLSIDRTIDAFFWLDLCLNFIHAYFDDRAEEIVDPRKIVFRYLRTWFVVDLLSCLPFEQLVQLIDNSAFQSLVGVLDGDTEYIQVFFGNLLKIFRLLRIGKLLKKLKELQSNSIFRLFKLLCLFVFSAHFSGAIFFAIGRMELAPAQSQNFCNGISMDSTQRRRWIDLSGLSCVDNPAPVFTKHLTAMYWALVSLATVGYGDIVPVSSVEMIWAISVMIMGAAVSSAIFGNVYVIVQGMDANYLRQRAFQDSVADFTDFHDVPKPLQKKIFNYVDYWWQRYQGFDPANVLSVLPTHTQRDILSQLHLDWLRAMPIFAAVDESFLRAIVTKLHPKVCLMGDTVTEDGDVGREMFLIRRGTAKVTSADGRLFFDVLTEGDFFGEAALVPEKKGLRNARVLALTNMDMFVLTQDDFSSIVKYFPRYAKIFESVARSRMSRYTHHLAMSRFQKVAKKARTIRKLMTVAKLGKSSSRATLGNTDGGSAVSPVSPSENDASASAAAAARASPILITGNVPGSETTSPVLGQDQNANDASNNNNNNNVPAVSKGAKVAGLLSAIKNNTASISDNTNAGMVAPKPGGTVFSRLQKSNLSPLDIPNAELNGPKSSSPDNPNSRYSTASARFRNAVRLVMTTRRASKESRKYWYIIRPDARLKRYWDMVVIVFVLLVALAVPLDIGFNIVESFSWLRSADYVGDIVFLTDVVLRFVTGYYNSHGTLVLLPKKIARRYITGTFVFDLIGSIPVDMIGFPDQIGSYLKGHTEHSVRLASLMAIGRMLRFNRVMAKLNEFGNSHNMRIIKLMFTYLLISHWIACFFFMTSRIQTAGNLYTHKIPWVVMESMCEGPDGDVASPFTDPNSFWYLGGPFSTTMSNGKGLCQTDSPPPLSYKYATAIYFTIVTLGTVGYGDISPQTDGDRIMGLATLLIGAVASAVILGNVSAIIDAMGQSEDRKRAILDNITEFLMFNDVPNNVVSKVTEYVDFFWIRHKGYVLKEVLQELPTHLKVTVAMSKYGKLLRDCYIFKKLDDNTVAMEPFLKDISWRLVPMVALPGQVVGEVGDRIRGIFFIVQGTLAMQSAHGDIVYTILRDGMNFGEQSALLSPFWTYTVVARSPCDILMLESDDFDSVIEAFPQYKAAMKMRAVERIERLKWIVDQKAKACEYDEQTVLKFKAELAGEDADSVTLFSANKAANLDSSSSVILGAKEGAANEKPTKSLNNNNNSNNSNNIIIPIPVITATGSKLLTPGATSTAALLRNNSEKSVSSVSSGKGVGFSDHPYKEHLDIFGGMDNSSMGSENLNLPDIPASKNVVSVLTDDEEESGDEHRAKKKRNDESKLPPRVPNNQIAKALDETTPPVSVVPTVIIVAPPPKETVEISVQTDPVVDRDNLMKKLLNDDDDDAAAADGDGGARIPETEEERRRQHENSRTSTPLFAARHNNNNNNNNSPSFGNVVTTMNGVQHARYRLNLRPQSNLAGTIEANRAMSPPRGAYRSLTIKAPNRSADGSQSNAATSPLSPAYLRNTNETTPNNNTSSSPNNNNNNNTSVSPTDPNYVNTPERAPVSPLPTGPQFLNSRMARFMQMRSFVRATSPDPNDPSSGAASRLRYNADSSRLGLGLPLTAAAANNNNNNNNDSTSDNNNAPATASVTDVIRRYQNINRSDTMSRGGMMMNNNNNNMQPGGSSLSDFVAQPPRPFTAAAVMQPNQTQHL